MKPAHPSIASPSSILSEMLTHVLPTIAGDLPEIVVFGDPAGAPAEARAPEAASCASSTVPRVFNRRPKLYITDYFNKPTE